MRIIAYLFTFILAMLTDHTASAQSDALRMGAVKGEVWDSARSAVLSSATVAVYRERDTTLVAYTISDKNGAFLFPRIPVGVSLTVIISFVGYKSMVRNLQLVPSVNPLEMGRINMSLAAGGLEEAVVVGVIPPVRMKGDTLEFHADAFKLDPNAQAEDLLRVLPGITIWADGVITVNGKEVSSVLVNGKPFFGTDARVATQNIPKNIIDKVQVYQKGNGTAQKDSATEINIKLKKGKDRGYFGKISGGYGTRNYYEMDGSINLFDRRTQLSIAGVSNNVNKIADGMSFLLSHQTFKGTGANVEYQSNFTMPGITRYNAGGVFFQHDLLDNPTYQNINRLTGEYFVNSNKQYLVNNTQTISSINDSSYFLQEDKSVSHNNLLNHQATARYEKKVGGNTLTLFSVFSSQQADDQRIDSSIIRNKDQEILSTNAGSSTSSDNASNADIIAHFDHTPREDRPGGLQDGQGSGLFSNYSIDYSVQLRYDHREQDLGSVYRTTGNPGLNRDLDRRYDDHQTNQLHKLNATAPGMVLGVFGLKNELEIADGRQNNRVMDKDSLLKEYTINTYLTNIRQEVTYNEKPALTISKNFHLSSPAGFAKMFSIDVSVGPQLFFLHSTSQKTFQRFNRDFSKMAGTGSFKFERIRTGAWQNLVILQVTASSQYPSVEQLAPLVDSANLNYIQAGNLSLKEKDIRDISLQFAHNSLSPRNTLTYYFGVTGGFIDDYFANSNRIDSLGRVVNTFVNANGYRHVEFNGQLKKSYKVSMNQFQLSISPTASLNRTPFYINNVFNHFSNLSLSYNPAILYTYADLLAVNMSNRQTYSWYRQSGADGKNVTNLIEQAELSFYVNCTKRLSVGSNLIYTHNNFNYTTVTDFTIWNASVAYRMLKGNNAELRLSGLDLLRQNTGLINFGSNNSVTQGKANVLQQYFMLTLTWYPRKFGK